MGKESWAHVAWGLSTLVFPLFFALSSVYLRKRRQAKVLQWYRHENRPDGRHCVFGTMSLAFVEVDVAMLALSLAVTNLLHHAVIAHISAAAPYGTGILLVLAVLASFGMLLVFHEKAGDRFVAEVVRRRPSLLPLNPSRLLEPVTLSVAVHGSSLRISGDVPVSGSLDVLLPIAPGTTNCSVIRDSRLSRSHLLRQCAIPIALGRTAFAVSMFSLNWWLALTMRTA